MKIYKIEKYDNSEIKEKIYLRMQSFKSDLYKVDVNKLMVSETLIGTASIKELLKSGVITDPMVINGITLEVGKSYFARYTPSNGSWYRMKISRITVDGNPWQQGDGICGIIGDCYEIEELTDESELKNFARNYLSDVDLSIKTLPEIFADMYNTYHK